MLSLFLKSFSLNFLAEMGDKTQLSTMGLAASADGAARHPLLAIFLGSVVALACTSALAVAFGGWIAAHVPPRAVKAVAGAVFVAFGAMYLWEAARR